MKTPIPACAALAASFVSFATNAVAQPVGVVPGWAGPYVGVNVGWGWGDNASSVVGNDAASALFISFANPPLRPAAFDVGGGVVGFQFGYNWQLAGRWVFGVEADMQLSDVNGDGTTTTSVGASVQTLTYRDHLRGFGTVRARAGYLVTDSVLVYATGGFAFGEVRQSTTMAAGTFSLNVLTPPQFFCPANAVCFAGGDSSWQTGWTVGGGGEFRFLPNLSLKLEYLYANFGSRDGYLIRALVPDDPNAVSTMTVSGDDLEYHFVRAGLNWHF